MRGISEETLIAVRESLAAEELNTDVIDALISLKVRELNQWLPIDENTPKDKWLQCWIEDLATQYILRFDTSRNSWIDQELKKIMPPDLYQELPDDPEPGDKNARN